MRSIAALVASAAVFAEKNDLIVRSLSFPMNRWAEVTSIAIPLGIRYYEIVGITAALYSHSESSPSMRAVYEKEFN